MVLADPEGNEFCVIEAGNNFLADCGFIGALACDGTQEVGYFWSKALDWPLVWDQDQETSIRSPLGGPKITWGGPPLNPKAEKNRLHFDLAPRRWRPGGGGRAARLARRDPRRHRPGRGRLGRAGRSRRQPVLRAEPAVTEPSPWDVEHLDLDAYLARVGVPASAPSREALDALHEAHVRAFTFDNIDVLLDQHPGVRLDAVEAKFVGRGRGGYCFEHGVLFAAALERLGYDVERRLGRVGDPASAARTHCVVVVTLDGEPLLADPGFGMSVLRPIPLEDGAEEGHGGWRYRLRAVVVGSGRTWALERWRDEHWELMHTHDELPVRPVDLAVGHHYTSTFPTIHFRNMLMLTRHLDGRHVAVTHETVTVRRPGTPTEHRELREGELADLLDELAVPLTADERAGLLARVKGLPSAR